MSKSSCPTFKKKRRTDIIIALPNAKLLLNVFSQILTIVEIKL